MQCDIDWFVWTRPVRSRCCPRNWSEKVSKTNCEENCQSCVRRVVGVKVQTMRSWIRTGAKMKVDLLDCLNKFIIQQLNDQVLAERGESEMWITLEDDSSG